MWEEGTCYYRFVIPIIETIFDFIWNAHNIGLRAIPEYI